MPPLELLELLDITRRQGPPTQFRSWHLLAAFRFFCQVQEPLGRYQLGAELQLGGGSIRSLIRFLRARNLIEPVKRQGHQISQEGRRHCTALKQVLLKLEPVPPSSYTVDKENVGCQLHNVAHLITDGLLQRDAALQAGATGATTFVQSVNPEYLVMPTDHQVRKSELGAILSPFILREGDVLIIGSGPTQITAQLGALAAALTLIQ